MYAQKSAKEGSRNVRLELRRFVKRMPGGGVGGDDGGDGDGDAEREAEGPLLQYPQYHV